jgi:hypothetical protein
MFSLVLFTFLKSEKELITRKYKDNIECDSINNLFGGENLWKNKAYYLKYLNAALYDE